jgi:hypothetical protein
VLTINFVTIYTGFGVFLGLLTPLLLVIDYRVNPRGTPKGRVYLLAGLLLSLASFASFFIGYKIQTAADCPVSHLQSPMSYAWFVCLMFAPFLSVRGIGLLPTVAGAVVVCALLASLALAIRNALRAQGEHVAGYMAITILTAYCLLFCLGTAYGRLCLGIQNAQESRYAIYLDLGLLGIYFSLLTTSNVIARNALAVVFALSLLGAVQPSQSVHYTMTIEHNVKQAWKNCYLAIGDIEECNHYSKVYPWEPERTHLQDRLDFLNRTHQNLFVDSR